MIEGYAIVFNKESRLLYNTFYEIILPDALDGVIEKSDVLALLNHNVDRGVLARSTRGKGSLSLSVEAKGVKYSYTAPKTVLGDEVVEGIARGDIRTSSFAFNIPEGGDEWIKRGDHYVRTIKKIEALYDVSAVYHEAYEDTTVALRNLDKVKETVPEDVQIVTDTKPVIEEPITEPIVDEKDETPQDFETRYLKQLNNLFKL